MVNRANICSQRSRNAPLQTDQIKLESVGDFIPDIVEMRAKLA